MLFNSVIQTAGKDPATRDRLYKFANQSIFDWFIARAIVQWSLSLEAPSKVIEDFVHDMKAEIEAGGASSTTFLGKKS